LSHLRWAVLAEDGSPLGRRPSHRDITRHTQTEVALKASEESVRRKLESLLSSDEDIGDLELADIIDAPSLQSFLDDFHDLGGTPLAIIDLKGRVLVGAGWSDICTRFHRVHTATRQNCIESDTLLTTGVPEGEYRLYQCKNHMWDVATPIVVAGVHMGNVFSGQFFFEDEPVDRELFRSQARTYGFDEEAYLTALDAVPRLSRETLGRAMGFFSKLAGMLSRNSHATIQLARSAQEREALLQALQISEERFRSMFERHHAVMLLIDPTTGAIVDGNLAAARFYGYAPEALRALSIHDLNQLPREEVTAAHRQAAAGERGHFVFPHRVAGGDTRWVEVHSAPIDVQGKTLLFSIIHDVTEPRRAEDQLRSSKRTLRALGNSRLALLHAVDERTYLEEVCRIIVEDCGHAMVWIGYAEDGEGHPVRPAAWSGFEEGYLETLNITWEDTERGRGPTGTAVRTGQPRICQNMLSDPAFLPWREEALRRGYASSIALPLPGEESALGALTIYSRQPDPFSEEEVKLLLELAQDLGQGICTLRLRASHAQAEHERELALKREHVLSQELAAANAELQSQNAELAAREEELLSQTEELTRLGELNEQLYQAHRSIAERLQRSIFDLPGELPGISFAHVYRSATEEAFVGGDFYDVFEAAEGRIGVVIGDVCGHGVEAARTATRVKDVIQAFSHSLHRPHHVLREANRLLVDRGTPGFVTVFLGLLDAKTGALAYSVAGHPAPLIVSGDAEPVRLEIPSLPIGILSASTYETRTASLSEDALLVLYTDGIIEARRDGAFFGEEGLLEVLMRQGAVRLGLLPGIIIDDVLAFTEGSLRDDVALLVLRRSDWTRP
jgi:PAS domain S-box-containing protein